MAYQHIYNIHLLNEIHNYFPDILYNRQRFQNVQDLLSYIQDVAEISPYDRGLQQYRTDQSRNLRQSRNVRQSEPSRYRYEERVNNISSTSMPPVPNTSMPPVPSTSMPPIPNTTQENDRLINNVLSGISFVLDSTNLEQVIEEQLQSFLDHSVIVCPTAHEIQAASTTFASAERQDDICAICRDEIIIEQQVRRLTYCSHYFHKVCIDSWFLRNVQCPTCRHDIRDIGDIRDIRRWPIGD